jgi:hypothetical protein
MSVLALTFWAGFAFGYTASVVIETPVLLMGLSPRHPLSHRLFAGIWLTACTYPVVYIALPPLFASRGLYLAIAETFAPVAECLLFWAAFGSRQHWGRASMWRDLATIVVANLASFAIGELLLGIDAVADSVW